MSRAEKRAHLPTGFSYERGNFSPESPHSHVLMARLAHMPILRQSLQTGLELLLDTEAPAGSWGAVTLNP